MSLSDLTVREDRGEFDSTVRAEADAVDFDDFTVAEPTDTDRWFISEKTPVDEHAPLVPPAESELARGTRVGEYEVEEKIGEGAMGTIYRCVHPTIGKHVAVKLIAPRVFHEPAAVKRFIAEARAVAKIGHPNIVHVFGFGRLRDGRLYLTMEWLEGASLAARIAHGDLGFEASIDILRQIARALEAAHAKGIVHRDLKPENVFLQYVEGDELPVAKLLDFGLAKNVGVGEDSLSKKGQILGTPMYMSPEQCRGELGVDASTDIYALGCLAYQLLAGRLPFTYQTVVEQIAAHVDEEPPRPRALRADLPPELDALLYRMIAKDPRERPPLAFIRRTLGGLGRATPVVGIPAVALEFVKDEPKPAAEPTAKIQLAPRSRWPTAIALALGAAAVIALGVLAFT